MISGLGGISFEGYHRMVLSQECRLTIRVNVDRVIEVVGFQIGCRRFFNRVYLCIQYCWLFWRLSIYSTSYHHHHILPPPPPTHLKLPLFYAIRPFSQSSFVSILPLCGASLEGMVWVGIPRISKLCTESCRNLRFCESQYFVFMLVILCMLVFSSFYKNR